MAGAERTKEQLAEEVEALRARLTEWEQMGAERKRVQETQQYLDIAGVMIVAIDADQTVSLANRKACQILGYEEGELIGKNWFDTFLPERDSARVKEIFNSLMAGEIEPVAYFENPMLTREGEERIIAWHSTVRVDATGQITGALSSGEDITEWVRVEEALRRREQEIRLIADNVPALVSYVDADGCYRFVSKRYEEWFGIPQTEIVGRHYREVLGETTYELIKDRVEAALSGQSVSYEDALPYASGGTRWVLADYVPDVDTGGEVKGFFALVTDITQRKQAEEALRESEQKLRLMVEGSIDGIVMTDTQGNVSEWNQGMEQITGMRREAVLSRPLWEVQTQSAVGEGRTHQSETYVRDTIRAFFETGQAPWLGHLQEVDIQRPDGSVRSAQQRSFSIETEEGFMLCGIVRDVTERKQSEQAIERSNRELSVLLNVSRQLIQQTRLEERLHIVAQSIVNALPAAEAASLWLYDGEGDDLVVRAWSGYADETVAGLAVPPGTSLVGKVYRTGQPLIVSDTAAEPAFVSLGRPALDAVRSVLGAPLLFRGQPIGVLFADNFTQKGAFGEDDLRLLQSLAGSAAIAIQNSRYHERLRVLATRLSETETVERRRLARELHDQVGQNLTALSINLNVVLSQLPETTPDLTRSRLEDTLALIEQTAERIRDVMDNLRPAVLDDYGLCAALRWQGSRLAERAGIAVVVQCEEPDQRLRTPIENTLFHIAQEALTNVAKHAQATQAVVTVEVHGERVCMVVTDDGMGFDLASVTAPAQRKGWGLMTMAERAEGVGGACHVESAPGKGTRVMVEVPL